jgi:hypothetical protein
MTKQSPGAMTRAEVLALPAVVPLWPTAAGVIGVGRTRAYTMVGDGTWPTRVLRLGNLIKVPTADLLDLLGIEPDAGAQAS